MFKLNKDNGRFYFRTLQLLSVVFLSLAWQGCAVGPDFKIPRAPNTNQYADHPLPYRTVSANAGSKSSGKSQHFVLDKDIKDQWWRVFHSRSLNCLIESGLQNSPTLEAAQAALLKSEENMNAYLGTLVPAVTGSLSGKRQRISGASFGGLSASPTIFSLYNASVNVSYSLDIFGDQRKVEALCAEVEYQRFLYEATYLTLTANIVTTAIAEASLRAQIQATRDIIQSSEKQLAIMQKQFQLGSINKADVLTQETELAQVRATLPPLEKQLSSTRHSLAVLIGSLPSENLPRFHLQDLNLAAELPVSMPSLLVQQRPDIRASEALLHQASAQIGVATANLLPQITLNGNYGSEANKIHDLFKGVSTVWGFGGQLLQPIVEGGSLRAKRRAAIAAYEEAAAKYRETVLKAFQNVADTLRALELDAKALVIQVKAENSAKTTLTLTQKQFKLGAVNYIVLLNAERQYQQSQILRIQAEATRFADTAALFQALGGGWWNRCYDPMMIKKKTERR